MVDLRKADCIVGRRRHLGGCHEILEIGQKKIDFIERQEYFRPQGLRVTLAQIAVQRLLKLTLVIGVELAELAQIVDAPFVGLIDRRSVRDVHGGQESCHVQSIILDDDVVLAADNALLLRQRQRRG